MQTAAGRSTTHAGSVPAWLVSFARRLATAVAALVAVVAGVMIWNAYVVAPWTRDGRTRVQVANVAPQIAGQITQLHVVDNQAVRKGDLLYVIDPFDYKRAVADARATLQMRAADLLSKRQAAERRAILGVESTSIEEKQTSSSTAAQAEAMFHSAQSALAQAEINLRRTEVRSPVNGIVTNLQMRAGDYAQTGSNNLAVIDTDSYWIDGYFEETKMRYVCVGERATATLMGYRRPIVGVVESITRGISTSDASASTQGLPNVNPVYTWVRLAQRVPVRIRITDVPAGVPLVAGMTLSVTLDSPRFGTERTGLAGAWAQIASWFDREPAEPSPTCDISSPVPPRGPVASLPEPTVVELPTAAEVNPTLAPAITAQPGPNATNPGPPPRLR